MRLSGSVREYACASEGEENAALYNMACCWAVLGQKQVQSGQPHNAIVHWGLHPCRALCCLRPFASFCKAVVECLPALQSALTVLEALLDNSFDDYAAIRTDPDLALLRGPELDQLLSK
jgi:hypothetical protein